MQVVVEAYSGYKSNERPLRFRLGSRWHEVREVTDRWHSPEAVYFKVVTDQGDHYILRLDEGTGEWSLRAFRAGSG